MHWKETGGVEKLFALPSRHIPARTLFKVCYYCKFVCIFYVLLFINNKKISNDINENIYFLQNYQRHLTSRSFDNEEFSTLGPDLLPEQPNQPEEQTADTSVAKRLTRKRKFIAESEPEPEIEVIFIQNVFN